MGGTYITLLVNWRASESSKITTKHSLHGSTVLYWSVSWHTLEESDGLENYMWAGTFFTRSGSADANAADDAEYFTRLIPIC